MSLPMYLARRIVFTIPLIIGISLVAFIIANAIPADPTAANLGERAAADPQIVAAFRHKWGLDKPIYLQYLTYVRNLMRGDLGTSIRSHRPVTSELRRFLPATVELSTAGILVSLVMGVLFGVVSAVWRNRPVDFVVRILSLIGVSAPVFWLALVCLLVFYLRLRWLPGPGRLDARLTPPPTVTGMYTVDSLIAGQWHTFDNALAHLILPALVLGAYSAGLIARVTRSSMLEVLSKEYMMTARSKGLPERTDAGRHRHRPVVRESPVGRGADRDDLRLERHRALCLQRGPYARFPGHHGSQHADRRDLYRDESDRRYALLCARSAHPGSVADEHMAHYPPSRSP
jgi:peptide/nickel transport system permease protein